VQVQVTAGVEDEEIQRYERYVRPKMPEQHRKFFNDRSVLYIAVDNGSGVPVTGVIVGPTGAPLYLSAAAHPAI
jgi:hypothetical protein